MEVRILGTGCKKCKAMEENAREALNELGVEAEVIKVTDLNEIMEYDVMMTPALVIGDTVKVFGRVPSVDEVKKWIAEER